MMDQPTDHQTDIAVPWAELVSWLKIQLFLHYLIFSEKIDNHIFFNILTCETQVQLVKPIMGAFHSDVPLS